MLKLGGRILLLSHPGCNHWALPSSILCRASIFNLVKLTYLKTHHANTMCSSGTLPEDLPRIGRRGILTWHGCLPSMAQDMQHSKPHHRGSPRAKGCSFPKPQYQLSRYSSALGWWEHRHPPQHDASQSRAQARHIRGLFVLACHSHPFRASQTWSEA